MLFTRYAGNPIIPRTPGTFHSIHVANPDVITWQGKYTLFFRGQDERRHDEIGVAWADPAGFDGVHWQFYADNPIIKAGPDAYDAQHVLDPGAVVVHDRILLYYSAHPAVSSRYPGICLATSEDGLHFDKVKTSPVVVGMSPEVVHRDGLFYLFYTRPMMDRGQAWFVCTSKDGVLYHPWDERVVLRPTEKQGDFDAYTVVTPRIVWEAPWYYAIYAGSDRYSDYPHALGLARSRDLYHWERYPGNPIMARGEPGTWDEGALWFGTTMRHGDIFYVWYEGCGGGGAISRDDDYGGYAKVTFSQIGMATCPAPFPEW